MYSIETPTFRIKPNMLDYSINYWTTNTQEVPEQDEEPFEIDED